VTGSELVGLVPKSALLAAGQHYLRQMGRSTGVPEGALIHVAMRTLGLSEVKAFDPAERIIEHRLGDPGRLASMTLRGFADELSTDSPAPGGGSVAALAGALGAALAAMVANLSHAKKGFEGSLDRLDGIAVRGQEIKDRLLAAVDADTTAFDHLLEAMRLPKGTTEEQAAREAAIAEATVAAIEVPLGVLEACPEVIELCREVARIGLQASRSDAGTGAQVARAAAAGAYQNVCINLPGLSDAAQASALVGRADAAWEKTRTSHTLAEKEILEGLRAAARP
jgi:glutamate formiminotransferase/formiminotetrahydrofolate cyclodeaminase